MLRCYRRDPCKVATRLQHRQVNGLPDKMVAGESLPMMQKNVIKTIFLVHLLLCILLRTAKNAPGRKDKYSQNGRHWGHLIFDLFVELLLTQDFSAKKILTFFYSWWENFAGEPDLILEWTYFRCSARQSQMKESVSMGQIDAAKGKYTYQWYGK